MRSDFKLYMNGTVECIFFLYLVDKKKKKKALNILFVSHSY